MKPEFYQNNRKKLAERMKELLSTEESPEKET